MKEASPGPTAEYWINQGGEHSAVKQIGDEFGALGHGAGDNGGSGGSEYHLEHPEGENPGVTARSEITQEKTGGSKPAGAGGTEHQAEADGPIKDGPHGEIHQVLHYDVDRILGASKAGLNHCKSSLHEKDQGCGHQGPNIISMSLHRLDGIGIAGNGGGFIRSPDHEGEHE